LRNYVKIHKISKLRQRNLVKTDMKVLKVLNYHKIDVEWKQNRGTAIYNNLYKNRRCERN